MEIILKNRFQEYKKVYFHEGSITSIQSNNVRDIVSNLANDYSLIIINNYSLYFLGDNVLSEIEMFNGEIDYSFLADIFEKLNLSSDFFNRDLSTLSYTEKIYLNIIRNLCKNSKIVVFDDVFKFLDYKNQKRIKSLLDYLKDNSYTIIITSTDVNVLYKLADYSVLWYKKVFKFGSCDEVYTNVSLFVNNKISSPILPYITYKAMIEKNVKLFYSKDVRDIIKDIYKHV